MIGKINNQNITSRSQFTLWYTHVQTMFTLPISLHVINIRLSCLCTSFFDVHVKLNLVCQEFNFSYLCSSSILCHWNPSMKNIVFSPPKSVVHWVIIFAELSTWTGLLNCAGVIAELWTDPLYCTGPFKTNHTLVCNKYTERQKKLITSSECHSLNSKASTWIIFGHRLGKFLLK